MQRADSAVIAAASSDGLLTRVVPLVETTRADVVESVHVGALVVADAAGKALRALGDPDLLSFPRSSLKPFQLATLARLGGIERFGFTPAEVAVMASSHSGEEQHVLAVRSILAKVGADPNCLDCGPHEPLDADAAAALRRAGQPPLSLHNNCSGKHAGMLALARLLDAPLDNYLDPQHPAQRAIREGIGDLLDLDPGQLPFGRDGCSAPAYAVPLRAMARGFARLGEPARAPSRWRSALSQIGEAMRAHPALVGGSVGRVDTDLMRLGLGLVAKGGAEGYFCIGHPRGAGLALKVLDGDAAARARHVTVTAALLALGWLEPARHEGPLAAYGPRVAVTNWAGRRVGEARPSAALQGLEPLVAETERAGG